MAWIAAHKNLGRGIVLVLLVVALIGPWVYEVLITDAPLGGPCGGSLTLLKSGRCAIRLSGAQVIALLGQGFVDMSLEVLSGTTDLFDRAGEFFFMLNAWFLVLPLFSTLLLLIADDRQRLQSFGVLVWGLAVAPCLLLVLGDPSLRSVHFWGIWLFIGLAVTALAIEISALLARSTSG